MTSRGDKNSAEERYDGVLSSYLRLDEARTLFPPDTHNPPSPPQKKGFLVEMPIFVDSDRVFASMRGYPLWLFRSASA
jgi:hypothetical protein